MAVVIGHSRTEHAATLLTFSWHVPVFFVLAGYLLPAGRDAATELARRARSVLVPTLAWGLIVTAGWTLHSLLAGSTLGMPFLRRLLWGGVALGYPYSPFWFMPVLVLAVVLVRLLDAAHRWAALGVGIAGYLYCLAFPASVANSLWSSSLAPACLLFVLAGRQLKIWRPLIRRPLVIGICLLTLAGISLSLGVDRVNIKTGYFGTPFLSAVNAVLISAGLMLVAEAVFARLSPHAAFSRTTSLLAATSLPVILGHMLVLSTWGQPWTWPEIIVTIVVLWAVGLMLRRSAIASRYLL